MIRSLLVLVLAIATISCSKVKTSQKDKVAEATAPAGQSVTTQLDTLSVKMDNYAIPSDPKLKAYVVADISGIDFTLITERAGIFISPDTTEIERMKKEYGEEDFHTAADDNLYYEYEADIYLEQKSIKTIYPKTRYLKLKLHTGQEYFFDTKPKGSPSWYLILFDPSKDSPAIINAIDIAQEYTNYFEQK